MTLGTFAHTRDMEVAVDVSRMIELRRFEEEFNAYGCIYFANGERRFLISGKEEKIWGFRSNMENYDKYPLIFQKYSLKTTVPAGSEETILESLKIQLAKELQKIYDPFFCSEFLDIAQTKPDNQAEPILRKLQDDIAGLYRADLLIAFEGLLGSAYRGKHLTVQNVKSFREWLQRERKEMETNPIVERRLHKVFYGICYYKDGIIKSYCNGEKAKVYEKQEYYLLEGYFVSGVYEKEYWHNGELSIQKIKEMFIKELLSVFDKTYFSYLNRIMEFPSAVNIPEFRKLENKWQNQNNEIKRVLMLYRLCWGI